MLSRIRLGAEGGILIIFLANDPELGRFREWPQPLLPAQTLHGLSCEGARKGHLRFDRTLDGRGRGVVATACR
jgi:hypothetical protein